MKHLFLMSCLLYFLTICHVYAPSKPRPSSSRQREPSHSVRRSSRAPENVERPTRTAPKKKDNRPPVSNALSKLNNRAEDPRSAKPTGSRKRHKGTTAGNDEIVVDFQSENPTVKTTQKVYKVDPNAGPVTIKIPSSGAKITFTPKPKDSARPKDTSQAVPSSRKPYIEEPPEPRKESSRAVPSGSRPPKTTSRTQQAHGAPAPIRAPAPPRQDPAVVNTGGKSGGSPQYPYTEDQRLPPSPPSQVYDPPYGEAQYQYQEVESQYQYQIDQSKYHAPQPPSPRSLSPESVNTSDSGQANHDWNENEYIFDRKRDIIGSGSFGKVYRVIRKSDGAQFALKEVPYKRVIHDKTEYRHTIEEITTLQALPHTVFVGLVAYYAGQHDDAFRFVLEWIPGGDFFTLQDSLITNGGRTFKESEICYYGGQVLLGLHYMHTYLHRAYRDLKPENILVGLDGSIKLTDFGLVANLRNDDGTQKRATTFCGTPEFLAPEVILGQSYTTEVDMWSLGVFMYEMRRGFSPFKPNGREIPMQMYENIVNYKKKNGKFVVDWDKNYFSPHFHSLLTHLLDREPSRRFTATDAYEHRFFKSCHAQWTSVNHENFKTYFPTAPYRPEKKEYCLDRRRGCYEYTDSYGNLGYIPKEEEEGFNNF